MSRQSPWPLLPPSNLHLWLTHTCVPANLCWSQVSGQDSPEGISSFEDVDLPPALMENVKRCKYSKPTPVQVCGVCFIWHTFIVCC